MKNIGKWIIRCLLAPTILFAIVGMAYSADKVVYITKTGTKYHNAGCSYLRKSAIPINLSEASQRYSPCSKCNLSHPSQVTSTKEKTSNQAPQEKPHVYPEQDLNKHTDDEAPSTIESKKANETVVGTTPTGKTIYEGPRGGRYHYSKSGKKVYEKRK